MKNFVRGMGIGILITTLVFSIAYMLIGNKMSDDEIRERAAKLGMVEQDTTVVKSRENADVQLTDGTNQAAEPDDTSLLPPSDETTEILTPYATTDPDNTGAIQQNDIPVNASGNENAVLVQIGRGQDGITISQILQQAGVITDATDFNRYLSDNHYQLDILWGEFWLEKNMEYDAIVKKIISK